MGGEHRDGTFECGRNEIRNAFVLEQQRDMMIRGNDPYSGSIGQCGLRRYATPLPAANTKTQINKNAKAFFSVDPSEKWVVEYAVLGIIGTIGYVPKVDYAVAPRGVITVNNRGFKNISELKKALKTSKFTAKELMGHPIYSKDKRVGNVTCETHVWKTKPTTVPARYLWTDDYVVVGYKGIAPC